MPRRRPAQLSAPPGGRLFQERLRGEPFWMLAACQLVNLTTWRCAAPVLSRLRRAGVRGLAAAEHAWVAAEVGGLGLGARRALSLVAMADAWLECRPVCRLDVLDLPGCGAYAADSWSVFVEDDLSVRPTDGKLNWYLEEVRLGRRKHLNLHPRLARRHDGLHAWGRAVQP